MSAFAAWSESFAGLAGDSIVLTLVAKWTVLLAIAWIAHGMLAGRNPRWRVALWHATVGGIGLVAFLSSAPPIVKYRLAPPGATTVQIVRSASIAAAGEDRAPKAAVAARDSIEAIDRTPPSTTPAWTEGGTHIALKSQRAEPVPSASAEGAGAGWGAGVDSWIASIWLVGVLVLSVRLIVGSVGLTRVVRRSSDVPDDVAQECRMIALRLGCRPRQAHRPS